jgi:hypothetical protein
MSDSAFFWQESAFPLHLQHIVWAPQHAGHDIMMMVMVMVMVMVVVMVIVKGIADNQLAEWLIRTQK